jgi:hypothetical protein
MFLLNGLIEREIINSFDPPQAKRVVREKERERERKTNKLVL